WLLHVMEAQTSPGGFIPEQVWDTNDIPDRELFNGKPSGSAMPLMWAHAEYIKLLRSLRDGRVFDLPPQTVQRYLEEKIEARVTIWRFNQKSSCVPGGYKLRIELLAPATIVWTSDGWASKHEEQTKATGLNIHLRDIPTDMMPIGTEIDFSFCWPNGCWEGQNFKLKIV